jgi:DNA-binding CsgD family transcriptional regulator
MAINPNLTLNEKRLCAFLRLDMTSKEISAITGQSVRAIEQARIRLRKQLGLTNQQVSLSAFLSSL